MKKTVYTLLLLALGVGGTAYYVGHAWSTGPARAFRTAAVERGDVRATISATGTIEPEEVVDVGAQVAGQVKEFGLDPKDGHKHIDYGSQVEEGTVLARIDDSVYQSQVDQAQAQLAQSKAGEQRARADLVQMKAKVTQTQRDWQRAQMLGPGHGNAISGLDYDTAKAAYETARSALAVGEAAIVQAQTDVARATAALKQAETNLGYCTIRSPVKGVIVDRRVNVGQTVVASLNAPSLFLIAKDLTRLQIWASVNEADIGQIHPGQPVYFTVDAYPNDVFRGTVAQIRLNATMTQNVVTYTVVIDTDNANGKLLPYLTANVQFEVADRQNVLEVPNAALRWRPKAEEVAPDVRAAYLRSRQAKPAEAGPKALPERHDQGVVWMQDKEYVRPVPVKVGLGDGAVTEISGDGVREGTPVVVGEQHAQDGAATTNPFTPKLFGNGSKK
jgi:HlyD family secretion protein